MARMPLDALQEIRVVFGAASRWMCLSSGSCGTEVTLEARPGRFLQFFSPRSLCPEFDVRGSELPGARSVLAERASAVRFMTTAAQSCAVKIISGVATETTFAKAGEWNDLRPRDRGN